MAENTSHLCAACVASSVNERGVCPQCGRPSQRFTDRAREVMVVANARAKMLLAQGRQRRAHAWWLFLQPRMECAIEPRDVLAAILLGPKGIGYHAVASCGVDPAGLAAEVESLSTQGRRAILPEDHRLPMSSSTRRLVQRAVECAHAMKHDGVGTEHLMLAAIESLDRVARRVLSRRGVTRERLEMFVRQNSERLKLSKDGGRVTSIEFPRISRQSKLGASMGQNHSLEEDASRQIVAGLAAGFDSTDDIRRRVIDCIEGDYPDERGRVSETVSRLLADEIARRADEMRNWPQITDCDRLDAAFEELNRRGIMARHNWTCCSTCGQAEMPDEFMRLDGQFEGVPIVGYTFYDFQDVDAAVDGEDIYLNYGSTERAENEAAYTKQCLRIAEIISETLRRHGLTVTWDGTYARKIGVTVKWQRRSAPPRFCGDSDFLGPEWATSPPPPGNS